MSAPNIPGPLIKAIKNRECVLFVGAGVSQAAGLPGWSGLLSEMVSWCRTNDANVPRLDEVDDLIQREKYVEAAQVLEDHLAKPDLRECLKSIFEGHNKLPTDTHLLLTQLPFRAALTTNFDNLLESAFSQSLGYVPKTINSNSKELSSLYREEGFYVLKTHGTIQEIDTVVLGRKRFVELTQKNKPYRRLLEDLLHHRRLFFVGSSLRDHDLLTIIEQLNIEADGDFGPHYALMPEDKLTIHERDQLSRDYRIHILAYRTSEGSHREVNAFLNALVDEGNREERAGATNAAIADRPVAEIPLSAESPDGVSTVALEDSSNASEEWRSQLEQMFALTAGVLSSESNGRFQGTSDKMGPAQIIRLELLAKTLAASRLPDNFPNNHAANYLYLQRHELELAPAEREFVLRMLVNNPFGYVPGWYLLRGISPQVATLYILGFALNDPLESTRESAFRILTQAEVPVSEFPERMRSFVRSAPEDHSPKVRKACIEYLGTIGGDEELLAVSQSLIDEDPSVAREALNSHYAILLRHNPSRAFDQMLKDSRLAFSATIAMHPGVVTYRDLMQELPKYSTRFGNDVLVAALSHQQERVKIFAIENLKTRGEFTRELAIGLKDDPSGMVRELAYRELIDSGETFPAEEIMQKIPDDTYRRNTSRASVFFAPRCSDPDDVLLQRYKYLSPTELWKLVDWGSVGGHVAYRAIGVFHFTEVAQIVRDDLRDEFKATMEVSVKKERDELVNDGRVTLDQAEEMARGWVELLRPRYIAAGLAALAANGEPHDAEFGREYLSNDDYDVRVEAAGVVSRLGASEDAATLFGIAKRTEGTLQEVAASGALRLIGGPTADALALLQSGDKVLISLVLRSFLDLDHTDQLSVFLEPLLCADNEDLRLAVLAYFAERFSDEALESVLGRYTSGQTYYYDVVCWLDRVLYTPARLRQMYRRKLDEHILAF